MKCMQKTVCWFFFLVAALLGFVCLFLVFIVSFSLSLIAKSGGLIRKVVRKCRQLPLLRSIWWMLRRLYQQKEGARNVYNRLFEGRQAALAAMTDREPLEHDALSSVTLDLSVVTYNSSTHLTALLDSMVEQDFPTQQLHLIFVDNASTDNTVSSLMAFRERHERQFHKITIIELKENIGFGRGHNLAAKQAVGDFLLITNPDLTFEKETIVNVISSALADDLERVASWELRQKPYEHPKIYDPITLNTCWSSAACLLLNLKAFEAVGGFEPRLFLYGEDVELSYRFIDHGWLVKYCPHAVVWHYTYDEPDAFKPAQFQGSILANGLLKVRYGSFVQKIRSVLQYPGLYYAIFLREKSFNEPKLRWVIKAYYNYYKNLKYFATSQKKSTVRFPFNDFDYTVVRAGAFYEHLPMPSQKSGKVSIVMRTHGDQLFWLREAIASVFNQTYQHIELVLVEDGGSHAREFAESLQVKSRHVDIQYHSLEKVGRSATGNYGLSKATGDYLMFLDSDDYLFAEHVEILLAELVADDAIDLTYSLAWSIPTEVNNSQVLQEGYQEISYELPESLSHPFCMERLHVHNLFPIQAALFRRKVYQKCGGFDESLDYLEDWNLWLRYAHYFTFKMIPKLTSSYRVPANPFEASQRIRDFSAAESEAVDRYLAYVMDDK